MKGSKREISNLEELVEWNYTTLKAIVKEANESLEERIQNKLQVIVQRVNGLEQKLDLKDKKLKLLTTNMEVLNTNIVVVDQKAEKRFTEILNYLERVEKLLNTHQRHMGELQIGGIQKSYIFYGLINCYLILMSTKIWVS